MVVGLCLFSKIMFDAYVVTPASVEAEEKSEKIGQNLSKKSRSFWGIYWPFRRFYVCFVEYHQPDRRNFTDCLCTAFDTALIVSFLSVCFLNDAFLLFCSPYRRL